MRDGLRLLRRAVFLLCVGIYVVCLLTGVDNLSLVGLTCTMLEHV